METTSVAGGISTVWRKPSQFRDHTDYQCHGTTYWTHTESDHRATGRDSLVICSGYLVDKFLNLILCTCYILHKHPFVVVCGELWIRPNSLVYVNTPAPLQCKFSSKHLAVNTNLAAGLTGAVHTPREQCSLLFQCSQIAYRCCPPQMDTDLLLCYIWMERGRVQFTFYIYLYGSIWL